MPKDTEFFERARTELALKNAELVAFGATRKAGVRVEDDLQIRALLDSQAPVVTIVAKSDVRHVAEALRTTLEENVAMVQDSVRFLVGEGRRVFVDMEHFFDGYKHDPDYGVRLLVAAFEAGASVGVLCDTNGGMLPHGMFEIVTDVKERSGVRLGIHCQDDTGCAIANSVSAVEAGVTHVQCTANGYGERTGNADLFVVVPNLQLKLGIDCLPEGALAETVRTSHAIAEIANIAPNTHQPYAGWASFAHKAGLHASALKVNAELYNHIDPAVVGNAQNVLVTEMAGRASIELKGAELGHDLSQQPDLVSHVVERVKALEAEGWTFEAADASFELLILDAQGKEVAFEVESWRTIVEQDSDGVVKTEATVKVHINGDRIISTAEGNGPVNALDRAMRRAIVQKYPDLDTLRLVDYKVRILDEKAGTGAKTRVLIGTSDGHDSWSTVGVHENVIAASWRALEDSVRYGLLRRDR
jgi:2-isopropylmalate synthase